LTPEQQLEKAIAKDLTNTSKYLELAELHQREEKWDKAEAVLNRALSASGGDVALREKLEDLQLKRAQKQVAVAEHRARQEPSPEAQALCDKLKVELNNKALEVFRCRSERYPNNLAHKFELGVCLARARNYTEAIKVLQEARADPKRKGLVLYRLGTCFEAIKQYKLAMSNYAAAVTETGERDEDHRKAALYSAGRLAMQLQDWEAAEKYLTDLAGLDFGYRDVAERLDNLTKMREDGASP
jgi:tetratricopeptide (TPR) repeat protein